MKTHVIFGDLQIPYHDPSAVEVFMQIGEDLKTDTLVINGDFGDWRVISVKYAIRGERPQLVSELREEVHRQRELLKTICKRVKPKRKLWNDGNHEWRIFRALSALPNPLRLLELESIARACSVPQVLGLEALGFKYAGEYPHGQWLTDKDPGRDVWVEHGYLIRQKAGYLAQALMEKRMANVVTGHCERLAVGWKQVVGGRSFFACEGGNMSILGVQGKGDGIYSAAPFNVADLRDSQQGFVVIYEDNGGFYPYVVRIKGGRTVWNGKLYRS